MSKKSAQVILIAVCFIVGISGMASGDSIIGSKHDFSVLSPLAGDLNTPFAGVFQLASTGEGITETCVFCHTPHNASPGGFLWNRTNPLSTGNYSLYTSSTITMITIAQPIGLTLMCMSCHDGITSIAVNTLLNAPYPASSPADVIVTPGYFDTIGDIYYSPNPIPSLSWGPNIGNATGGTAANLANDHPVSFEWVPGIPGINAPVGGVWGSGATALKLFNNRMECSTCHDVHNPVNPPFLRMSNSNSDMCTTCHNK